MSNPKERPTITFAVRLYNCERYAKVALRAALAQTYSPLEIIVADDCSTDGTYRIAEQEIGNYRGPHRIVLYRNERNLGTGGQIGEIHRRMTGDILVVADGDDISLPHRAQRTFEAFRDQSGGIMGAVCHGSLIDYKGAPHDERFDHLRPDAERWMAHALARGQGGPVGALAAFHRRTLDAGTSLEGIRRCEDLILGLRALMLGRMTTIPDVLVHRRAHLHNVTGPAVERLKSGVSLRHTLNRHHRENVEVANVMLRDFRKFRSDRLITEDECSELTREAGLFLRELRLRRIIQTVDLSGKLMIFLRLRGLGMTFKQCARTMIEGSAPSLAAIILRRNPVARVALLEQSRNRRK